MQIKPTPQTPDAPVLPIITPVTDAKPKRIRRHGKNMARFNLSMSESLLERVDAAAEQDYMSRSELIRAAVLWYLRPHGRDLEHLDDWRTVLKTLEHRRALVESKKMMKRLGMRERANKG